MLEKLKLTCHSPQIKKTTSNKLCLSRLPCTICCTHATLKEKLPSFRGFLMVEHSEWKTKKCSYLVWCQHTSNRQNLSLSHGSWTYGDLLESLTELMRVFIIISIFFEAQQQQQQQQQQQATSNKQQQQQSTCNKNTTTWCVCWWILLFRDHFCWIVISWFRRLSTIMKNFANEVFRKLLGVFLNFLREIFHDSR